MGCFGVREIYSRQRISASLIQGSSLVGLIKNIVSGITSSRRVRVNALDTL